MTFSPNNTFEKQASGQADWDTGLEANFDILDRGFHGKFQAAHGISTGQILAVTSGGLVWKYNAASLSLRHPFAMSYKAVNSGETDNFLVRGIVSSLGVYSGFITAGLPVYVAAASPGFPVSSYSAAAFPAGIALSATSILFNPTMMDHAEALTQVKSVGVLFVNSTHHFVLDIGNRGIVRRLEIATSHNLWSLKLYSGSTAVNSELLFETQSGGVTSVYMKDQSLFPYHNTDVASWGLIFGKVTPSSGSGVVSGHFNVTIWAERFR